MRILHLISSGGMYGAEAVILNLSAELNGVEHDSSCLAVFSHDPQQRPALYEAATRAGVGSQLISCRGQLDLAAAGAIRKAAQDAGAEVVHAHGFKADIYSFLAFRGNQRPALVSTCHTWYDNDVAVRLYGAADRWVLRRFDEVVAVSAEVEDRLLRAGVSRQRVRLVRNGINVQRFAAAAEGRMHRPLGPSPLRVGLVGRLAPEKGVDLFLKAAAQVLSQVPDVEFYVAGDGPDRGALEALSRDLGLQDRAHLVGQQGNIADFYASLDLLVSSSRQEGLPIALLEGMASGLPVIATAVGAVPSVVVDGQTGVLVEPDAPEALSRAMLDLLPNAGQRALFGLAARERVQSEFSARRMAAEYAAVYQSAIARRTPRDQTARRGVA